MAITDIRWSLAFTHPRNETYVVFTDVVVNGAELIALASDDESVPPRVEVWRSVASPWTDWTLIATFFPSRGNRSRLAVLSPDVLLAVVSWEAIYRSTDGGETWNDVTPDIPLGINGPYAIQPVSATEVLIFGEFPDGEPFHFIRSTDAGATWSPGTRVYPVYPIEPPGPYPPAAWVIPTASVRLADGSIVVGSVAPDLSLPIPFPGTSTGPWVTRRSAGPPWDTWESSTPLPGVTGVGSGWPAQITAIVQRPAGDLIATASARTFDAAAYPGENGAALFCWRSTDNGATWSLMDIVDRPHHQENFTGGTALLGTPAGLVVVGWGQVWIDVTNPRWRAMTPESPSFELRTSLVNAEGFASFAPTALARAPDGRIVCTFGADDEVMQVGEANIWVAEVVQPLLDAWRLTSAVNEVVPDRQVDIGYGPEDVPFAEPETTRHVGVDACGFFGEVFVSREEVVSAQPGAAFLAPDGLRFTVKQSACAIRTQVSE